MAIRPIPRVSLLWAVLAERESLAGRTGGTSVQDMRQAFQVPTYLSLSKDGAD